MFAEKYLIPDLKELALFLLHSELRTYHISEAGGADFVKLVRYAYERTSHQGREDGKNNLSRLKAVVMEYAACWLDQLLRCQTFRDLLEENGAVALNFADMLSKRLF